MGGVPAQRDFEAGPTAMSWASASAEPEVGVGPHPQPWPDDPRLDPELLRDGDRRNVVDGYRYWRQQAIIDDLDAKRHPFHVAIENWAHDLNIGTVIRCANAFLAEAVHIVGRKKWNRRGAMVTDRYQHVIHHATIDELVEWCRQRSLPLLGVDNFPGSVPIDGYDLPRACMFLFGQEGPGLTREAQDASEVVLHIRQFGSTRSINAGVASAVAMHEWVRRHAPNDR
jgi:tRNA G18 (ribose-2'-O)-methylase SpoU